MRLVWCFFFFHLCRVTELKNHSNHFFLCFNQDSYGMAVKRDSSGDRTRDFTTAFTAIPKESGFSTGFKAPWSLRFLLPPVTSIDARHWATNRSKAKVPSS